MAREISIAISAKDNFTDSIKKMQNMQTAFRKDLGQLNNELDRMNKNKVELKVDMAKAKNELKEAEKSFKKLGDEASRNKLIMAQSNYDNVKRNFDTISQGAKQAERDIRNLTDTMTKSEGKGGNIGGSINQPTSNKGALGTLASAGLFSMLGQSASGAVSTGVSSMLGASNGEALGSIVSGAVSGAAMGSIIPGIGTAVGAVVGTVAGSINAMTQKFGERDEAFKSTVQDYYNGIVEKSSESLNNGSGIAGTREQTKISFSTLLGGKDIADGFLKDITNFAAKTPFQFDQLTTMSKTLLAYGYKMEEVIPLLTKVGDGGSALGMSPDDINIVATMLGRMKSTGKTTLEYLNPLIERGVPVFDFLSQSLGVSNQEVQEMVSKGLIPGAEAAQVIADSMGVKYEGNMEEFSKTYGGLMSTLSDLNDKMDTALGEAFNEERKAGIEKQIAWLEGESGAELAKVNEAIGRAKADLENQKEQIMRDVIDGVLNGSDNEEVNKLHIQYDEAKAEGDALKMGEVMAKAQVMAQNDFMSSEGYQQLQQTHLAMIEGIQADTAIHEASYMNGKKIGDQLSKGIASVPLNVKVNVETSAVSKVKSREEAGNYSANNYYNSYTSGPDEIYMPKKAFGIDYVPYDNYPALLHQGERVLTASEARSNSRSPNVTLTGNNFTVREEADINRIAREIVNELIKYQTNYGG